MSTTVQERDTVSHEIGTALRHSVVYGATNLLAKGIGFLLLPFYTHYLSPSDYGIMEILDLSMTLFGMFLNMGLTTAVLRCYASAESPAEKRKVISTAFFFVASTGLAIFLLGAGFIRPASAYLLGPHIPASYLLLSFCSFIALYLTSIPGTYLRAMEASTAILVIQTVGTLLGLAMNIYFIAALGMGVEGILVSSLIIALAQMVLLCAWMFRKTGLGFAMPYLRQMIVYGWPLTFSNFAMFTLNFSDRFFLQRLRSLDVVGVYSVGYKFGFIMNYLLIAPFGTMWLARMYIIQDHPDHRPMFGRIFVLYSVLLIYAALGLALLGPEAVRVMTAQNFWAGGYVIAPVALGYVFWGIGYYAQTGMYLSNRTHAIGVISAGTAVLNLGLNYFLVWHYGMMGAAWATALSFLAVGVASYWYSQRVFPLPFALGRVVVALAAGAGIYMLFRWWSPASLQLAISIKVLMLAAFPVLLWKTGILNKAETGTLVSIRDRILARFGRRAEFVPEAP